MKSITEELAQRDLLELATTIARRHGVTVEEMWGDGHDRPSSHARQAFWAELQSRGHWSLSRIAQLARRARKTVLVGIRVHRQRAA